MNDATKFKDNKDRSWNISIDVASCRRVRNAIGVDIPNGFKENIFEKFGEDMMLFVDVLWELVRPEAEGRDVSMEDFCGALDGSRIDEAAYAFHAAYANFFRGPKGDAIRKLSERTKLHSQKLDEEMKQALEDPDLDKKLDETLDSVMEELKNERNELQKR